MESKEDVQSEDLFQSAFSLIKDRESVVTSSAPCLVASQQPGRSLPLSHLIGITIVKFFFMQCLLTFLQSKDKHGNGQLGHIKRRKVSSMHYDKLARHFSFYLCSLSVTFFPTDNSIAIYLLFF